MAVIKVSQQFKRFCTVGLLNTSTDALLYVLLQTAGIALFAANFISTSAGLALSYLLNSRYTFHGASGGVRQLAKFVLVTCIGLWLLQPLLIHVLTVAGTQIGLLTFVENATDSHTVGFVVLPKLGAIAGVLVWNYLWYSRGVFARPLARAIR